MTNESVSEKIARIDANVQHIIKELNVVPQLVTDSAINKKEHRLAIWVLGIVATPAVLYVCKKLGVPFI